MTDHVIAVCRTGYFSLHQLRSVVEFFLVIINCFDVSKDYLYVYTHSTDRGRWALMTK